MNAEQKEEPPKKVAKIEQEETPPQIIEKVDRNDEEISIPNWLLEVLAWIKRTEMADSSLSTSCWEFNELCWPKLHGKKVKPHLVKQMGLFGKKDESGILQAKIYTYEYIDSVKFPMPFPNAPPPDYILGFKSISIYYLDTRVLDFFKCIAHKLNDVQFIICTDGMEKWGTKDEDKRTAMLDCLLNILACKIGQPIMYKANDFGKFKQLFPDFIDQLNSIFISSYEEIDFGVLYKWLTDRKENEGNKQKILELEHNEESLRNLFVRFEQEFTNATNPVNFLITFYDFSDYPPVLDVGEFTRENEKTGEILIPYHKQIGDPHLHRPVRLLLLRCPKGEEERWKEEGEKKLAANRFTDDANDIYVDINRFGDYNNMA